MKRFIVLFVFLTALGLTGCGGYGSMSNSSNQTPAVNGTWMLTFAAQSTTPPPSTSLTISFTQNGNNLTGTVTAFNNPAGSCFPAIGSGTTFTVAGQVSSAASSNLTLSVGFVSGSSTGTITGSGTLAYLATTASGSFSFMTGTTGCTSGNFSMTKTG